LEYTPQTPLSLRAGMNPALRCYGLGAAIWTAAPPDPPVASRPNESGAPLLRARGCDLCYGLGMNGTPSLHLAATVNGQRSTAGSAVATSSRYSPLPALVGRSLTLPRGRA